MKNFKQSMLELITQTSTNLPADVRRAMQNAVKTENPATQASFALQTIAVNIDMACDDVAPICQDTGMPTFEIKTPIGANQMVMKKEIEEFQLENNLPYEDVIVHHIDFEEYDDQKVNLEVMTKEEHDKRHNRTRR